MSSKRRTREELPAHKPRRKQKLPPMTDPDSDESEGHSDPQRVGDAPLKRRKGEIARVIRKKRKDAGEPYLGAHGEMVPGKSMKPNPCNRCKLRCSMISEDDRSRIFSSYYSLTPKQQNDWICSHACKLQVKRRRSTADNTEKRNVTYQYYVEVNGEKRVVCSQFIVATLAITRKKISYTLNHATSIQTGKPDARGKNASTNKTPEDVIEGIKAFIWDLPAVPAHYTRKNSNKRFLPSQLNRRLVYEQYKKTVLEADSQANYASLQVFKMIFNSFNIGFHKPKKDKCNFCEQIKNKKKAGVMTEEDKGKYKIHKKEKIATYEEYQQDITEAKQNPHCIVGSFDLEKILATPHSDSTLLYYSRKYAYYNLTVYENGSRKGFCYLWGECDGRKGAVEIATAVRFWLETTCKERDEDIDIILYCDNCPGQNKNRCMLGMLYHASQTLPVKSITLKFLITGHTYMGADTVHSTIASFIKKRNILAPSQWPLVISMARANPNSFAVKKMEFTDFDNWMSIQDKFFPNNMTDNESNRIHYTALRGITFSKSKPSTDFWYTAVTPKTMHMAHVKCRRLASIVVPKAYTQKQQISDAKFKDLRTLCQKLLIPLEFHQEYLNLPHGSNVTDCLDETGEVDSE